MSICCRDLDFKQLIGDIKSNSIEELWNSKKMSQYRELLASGKKNSIPICKNCSTIKSNPITRLGSIIFDDFTIRKILPLLEKISLKIGYKGFDYD